MVPIFALKSSTSELKTRCEYLVRLFSKIHGHCGVSPVALYWDSFSSGRSSRWTECSLEMILYGIDFVLEGKGPEDRKWDINGSGYGSCIHTNDFKCDVMPEESMRISGEVVFKDSGTLWCVACCLVLRFSSSKGSSMWTECSLNMILYGTNFVLE
ncbi:hypothetical protein CEXT_690381 [Caerostris extrusa]|uniref:Uncharacterized protein n=1 Tax=Caerostris extrusa TaxID=172846 RepID=A0AAV4XNV0_CAEEX|nr:hypothetical protein CEXT_690381 [Caerostris extrusa]